MGSVSSSVGSGGETETEKTRRIALNLYNKRLQIYDYSIHGPYIIYLYNITAQYELDCIPQDAMQGCNFNISRYG